MPPLTIVHDYLTQRGGAERVVLAMMRAFPEVALHTSLYDPEGTYNEFSTFDVRTGALDRIPLLRRNHRLAFPALAPSFSRLHLDADVVLCSSSGWAHGVRATGKKIVYCYSPAKWLHQPERYRTGGAAGRVALRAVREPLLRWDRRAAASADRYLVTSTAVQRWVLDAYGISAEIVPPPGGVDASGPQEPVDGVDPDFFLSVGRLLDYKNVDTVVQAFRHVPQERLVIVGSGPMAKAIEEERPANVQMLEAVSDAQLRWLYDNSVALIAAAHEDYGLTPLEAASFGKPTAALRWGGFLDTVVEAETGAFFDAPTPDAVTAAIGRIRSTVWRPDRIRTHAGEYSEQRFAGRLRTIVDEERQ